LHRQLSAGHAAQGGQRVDADPPPGLHVQDQHGGHRHVQLRGDALAAGAQQVVHSREALEPLEEQLDLPAQAVGRPHQVGDVGVGQAGRQADRPGPADAWSARRASARRVVNSTGTGDLLSVAMILLHRNETPVAEKLAMSNRLVTAYVAGEFPGASDYEVGPK
jgi:hypothetical protein